MIQNIYKESYLCDFVKKEFSLIFFGGSIRMKGKVFVFLIMGMLVTAFFASATTTFESSESALDSVNPVLFDEPVPVWNINDIWTYRITEVEVDFEEGNQTLTANLEIDEFPLEVKSDSGDQYVVEFSTIIKGDLYGYFEEPPDVYEVQGDLLRTTITGELLFDKATLGIAGLSGEIKGLMLFDVKNNGENMFPFQLPIPATINVDFEMDSLYTFFNFPLNTSCVWGLASNNVSINGSVQSIWLNIINFIDTIIQIIGMDPIIPPEYKDLFPVINIKEALDEFGFVTPITLPELPDIFACFGTETITVPAGTFECYNITILGGLGNMYYAPIVKNIIKISGAFADELPFINKIEMELTSFAIS
jgi:hypothetical protein